jgi:hypothetical protein
LKDHVVFGVQTYKIGNGSSSQVSFMGEFGRRSQKDAVGFHVLGGFQALIYKKIKYALQG